MVKLFYRFGSVESVLSHWSLHSCPPMPRTIENTVLRLETEGVLLDSRRPGRFPRIASQVMPFLEHDVIEHPVATQQDRAVRVLGLGKRQYHDLLRQLGSMGTRQDALFFFPTRTSKTA